MSMEYEIREWLDELIRVKNEAEKAEYLNHNIEAIMVSGSSGIHIYKGIELIAELIGLELHARKRTDGDTEFYFIYSNIRFFQICHSEGKSI